METINSFWRKLILKKRWHLFEFDDQKWLPDTLRRVYMNILGTNKNRVAPFAQQLYSDLKRLNVNTIHAICAGDGNFIYQLLQLNRDNIPLKFILSDLFPLPSEYSYLKSRTNGAIDYIEKPIDATKMTLGQRECFLMAGSLHHLTEEQVYKVFEKIIRSDGMLIMMENHSRTFKQMVTLIFLLPIFALTAPFFAKPCRFSNVFWGTLFPLVSLMIWFDGNVSNLRSYRLEDVNFILNSIPDGVNYVVEHEEISFGVTRGMYYVLRERKQLW